MFNITVLFSMSMEYVHFNLDQTVPCNSTLGTSILFVNLLFTFITIWVFISSRNLKLEVGAWGKIVGHKCLYMRLYLL